MIRSLVGYPEATTDDLKMRRNLEHDELAQVIAEDYPVWIDIIDPSPDEVAWLTQQFQLNPAVVEDLKRNDRRPTLMVYPNYLFLSLFEPHITLDHVVGQEIHCLVMDTCFITVRAANTEAVDAAYTRVVQSPDTWQLGVAYCFYLTAQHVIDTYYPLVDKISNRLSELEENLLDDGRKSPVRQPIYRIKQQLIGLRQMVAPQREVLSNIIGEKRLSENGNTRDLFHHLYERLLRVYDIIDSQRDLSSNVLDMMQNQESRKLVEAVNRLTILSMIFLPLTFFTGLFELNFATTSEPFLLPINGGVLFVLVIGAMLLSAGVMIYMFKRRGWL